MANKKTPYLLVRRPRQPPGGAFALFPADEKIPPPVPPLISLEDLDKFGRPEIVRVEVPVKAGRSPTVIRAVRKLQSPWGSAMSMRDGRRLTLTDTTAAVREIIKTLRAANELAENAAAK